MQVQTYLFFEGRCEEALDFYQKTLGAEVGPIIRFHENPDDPEGRNFPPGAGEMVMHSTFRIGQTTILASDGRCGGGARFAGSSLCLQVAEPEEAERLFHALTATGQIVMPMRKTFFSPAFGMVTDPFGVGWMILATA
ncbi:MAG TPA: VOC family protein [Acidisoma sp.]|jgi:PhnB protein|uniref:VOC family protein n=1 Tax=Acidisoma sp. TaxID=1872115 RepID=UPI002C4D36E0|nr:VOC family protein [Acidisoma sp.]HTI02090.1 VOC family protein [Acidisoma sp.]